jgi:hypothetical protein
LRCRVEGLVQGGGGRKGRAHEACGAGVRRREGGVGWRGVTDWWWGGRVRVRVRVGVRVVGRQG